MKNMFVSVSFSTEIKISHFGRSVVDDDDNNNRVDDDDDDDDDNNNNNNNINMTQTACRSLQWHQ